MEEKKESIKQEKKEVKTEETKKEIQKTTGKKEITETKPKKQKINEKIPEKKEEIKEENIQEKKIKKPFPVVITILAVIFLIVAGFAVNKLFFENTKQGEWTETTKQVVEIKNFYSSECSFCEKENSIIANFNARDINVTVESIDLAKEENKHFIEEFNLEMIPSALVNAKDLEEYPFEENLIKQSFILLKNYYVIPEAYLDSNPHNLMLLDETQECREGKKIFVEEFLDYQCLGCAMLLEPAKQARANFAGEIIFKHKNFIVHENSENAAIAAECAAQQNRFFEFNQYLFEKSFPQVFGIQKEGVNNSSNSIIQTGLLLTSIPDTNSFNYCFSQKEPLKKINEETALAKSYGINYAPSLVFDCKYIVQGQEQTSKIEELICQIHPELKKCVKDKTA